MGIKTTLSKIASIWQPAYKKINDWDSPWLRNICRELWDVMDDAAKKAVYNLAMVLYARYGKEKAEEIMEALKKKFDDVIGQKGGKDGTTKYI